MKGVGFASGVGRLGAILSPFIILLERTYVPNLIFGLVGISSGLLILFLPETGGKPIARNSKVL